MKLSKEEEELPMKLTREEKELIWKHRKAGILWLEYTDKEKIEKFDELYEFAQEAELTLINDRHHYYDEIASATWGKLRALVLNEEQL